MIFCKANGAGNDFIIINNFSGEFDGCDWPSIARLVCDRRMSIGADGFMVVEKADDGSDFRMRFFNNDGSVGEMCGNGARCICRFGYEAGLSGEKQTVQTTAGVVIGERIDRSSYRIRLNDPTTIKLDCVAEIDGAKILYDYVELGDPGIPHVVVHIENLEDIPKENLSDLGSKLRYYKDLPKGANVNFYEVKGDNHLFERTFERGVEDFTYACGTGTGSLVSVLTLKKIVDGRDVQVDMEGGRLIIDIDMEDGKIVNLYLTGPTNMVARGEITDDNLEIQLR